MRKTVGRATAIALSGVMVLAGMALANDLKSDLSSASGQQTLLALGSGLVGGTAGSHDNSVYYNGSTNLTSVTFAVDTKPSWVSSVGGGTINGRDDENAVTSVIAYSIPCALGVFSGDVTYKVTDRTGSNTDPIDTDDATVTITGNVASLGSNCGSAYTLTGFYAPVENKATLDNGTQLINRAKAGQTIPLKFNIWDGTTAIDDTAAVSVFTAKTTCTATADATLDNIEQYSTGSTTLRWDADAGQFVFNWKTDKSWATQCWRVRVVATGGDQIVAEFTFTR
jgi:hypothetical protein